MKVNKEKFLKEINNAKNIYIMGHKNLDLDAIGSAIGLAELLKQMGKEVAIIHNDDTNELAVEQVLIKIKDDITLINGSEFTKKDNDLLIIVDTNKKSMVQDSSLVDNIKNKIIIDHHETNEDTIISNYSYINCESSSTCEILTELLEELGFVLKDEINTFILAGIVLDTNNFVVKTDEKTYYSAYQLCSHGANPMQVQYLLKQDLNDYIARQKVITNVQVLNNIAITKGAPKVIYRREELAKIADTLLQFKSIEASFVIGVTGPSTIGISARSMGNYPVSKIMTALGGGGDTHDAATRIEGETIEEVEEKLLTLIQQN